jgi:hypothetical protein
MLSRAQLHSHQRRAIALMLSKAKVFLALDMGMGKTAASLTSIVDLKNHGIVVKVLVVAPKRVAESVWLLEAQKWSHLAGLAISLVAGSAEERSRALDQTADIYVIGRDNVAWLVEHLTVWPFTLLIIDEASSFKSASSKRFKALRRVRAEVDRCWMLSGTPAPNSLLDLWPQYFLLDGGERLGRTFSAYRNAYFESDHMGWTWAIKPGAELLIHQKISDITVSMQAEDYLTLPDRIDNHVAVILGSDARQAYRTLEKDYVLKHGGDLLTASNAAVLAGKLLQLANGAVYDENRNVVEIHTGKLDALSDITEAMNGKPLLVFYLFQHDLARIKAAHPKARKLNTPADIADWNAGRISLLIAHPASCGHGINLQGAAGSAVCWFGLPWSLELYQQANARVYRQGVNHTVVIHHLMVEDSIDQDVMAALTDKAAGQGRLLDALKQRVAA